MVTQALPGACAQGYQGGFAGEDAHNGLLLAGTEGVVPKLSEDVVDFLWGC